MTKNILLTVWLPLAGLVLLAFVIFPIVPLGLGPLLDQALPVLLIVVLGFVAWRYIQTSSAKTTRRADIEFLVPERYAKGEIKREQYLQILDNLK